MTIGSKHTEQISNFVGDCGPAWYGLIYDKSWSGGDSMSLAHRSENPYSMSSSSILNMPVSFSVPSDGYTHIFWGTPLTCGWIPSIAWPTWGPNDEILLYGKAFEKMRGHSFNAAVSLGEAHESVAMIAATAKTLAESFSFLRHGRINRALRGLRIKPRSSVVRDVQHDLRHSAGNAWLGLTYGWKPLLSDAANAAEALAANIIGARKSSFRVRRKIMGALSGTSSFSKVGEVYTSVDLKLELTRYESALSEFGFTRPETLAWELLPFSFVADWFMPIGNYLEDITTLRNVEGTYVRSSKSYARVRLGTISPAILRIVSGGDYDEKQVRLVRTTGPLDSSLIKRPTWKSPLSVSHATSAISLLQSVFKK